MATSGSIAGRVEPASECRAPPGSTVADVIYPITGAPMPSACCTRGSLSATFHPARRSPASVRSRRRAAWAASPRNTAGLTSAPEGAVKLRASGRGSG